MVKRLLIFILLILPCILCLTTCDLFVALFSLSPFPGYLAQAVATVNMRDDIEGFLGDDYDRWDSDVFVVRNTVREQVFLVVRKDPGPQMIYVFDTSLNLEKTNEVNSHRRIALVEAAGVPPNFVVGGGRFQGDNLDILNVPLDSSYPSIPEDTWQKYTFAHGGRNYVVWSDPNQLACSEYDPSWGMLSTDYTQITVDEDCRLAGLGYEPLGDPILGGAIPVYLFVFCREWESDNGFLYIIRTEANQYPDHSAITTDMLTDLPPEQISARVRDVEDRRPFRYTRKGVVVEARNRGTFRLVSLEGDVIKSFFITSDERTPFDFDIDGDYYYIFDKQNFRLYKAATGF